MQWLQYISCWSLGMTSALQGRMSPSLPAQPNGLYSPCKPLLPSVEEGKIKENKPWPWSKLERASLKTCNCHKITASILHFLGPLSKLQPPVASVGRDTRGLKTVEINPNPSELRPFASLDRRNTPKSHFHPLEASFRCSTCPTSLKMGQGVPLSDGFLNGCSWMKPWPIEGLRANCCLRRESLSFRLGLLLGWLFSPKFAL